jgi:ABC-2 type transport system permease protein
MDGAGFMRQFYTIFKREFSAYFNSPIAYIYIIVFLLITSGLFMSTFFLIERADMRSYFAMLPLVLAVFVPAVTMRLWAEERNLGTLSLLLSLPLRSYILVLGKFMAALAFYFISLACTWAIPIILAIIGNPDWGPIITGYIGTALVGCLFLAAGIFISALFKDQIVAFILSILVCFTMTLLGNDFVAAFIDGWVGGLGQMLQRGLGISYHFAAFER